MYKIIILTFVREKIDNFFKSYLDSSLSLFVDSGIENVELIEENYKNIAKDFRNKIYFKIDETFSSEILPKKVSENWELSCIIAVWNFRLFIDYLEDSKEKIRYIESIEFFRK